MKHYVNLLGKITNGTLLNKYDIKSRMKLYKNYFCVSCAGQSCKPLDTV